MNILECKKVTYVLPFIGKAFNKTEVFPITTPKRSWYLEIKHIIV